MEYEYRGKKIGFHPGTGTFQSALDGKTLTTPSLVAMHKKIDKALDEKFKPFVILIPTPGVEPGWELGQVTGVNKAKGRKNSWSNYDQWVYVSLAKPNITRETRDATPDTAGARLLLEEMHREYLRWQRLSEEHQAIERKHRAALKELSRRAGE